MPTMSAFKQLAIELQLQMIIQDIVTKLLHFMYCPDLNVYCNGNLFAGFFNLSFQTEDRQKSLSLKMSQK